MILRLRDMRDNMNYASPLNTADSDARALEIQKRKGLSIIILKLDCFCRSPRDMRLPLESSY